MAAGWQHVGMSEGRVTQSMTEHSRAAEYTRKHLRNRRTGRNPMGRYTPQSLSVYTRRRFFRDRRARYVAEIPTEPTDAQASRIETMIKLEWASLVAEAQGDLVGLREAREHTRLFHKLLDEFQESLEPKPVRPASKARPGPPQIGIEDQAQPVAAAPSGPPSPPTLDQHLEQIRRQRGRAS